MHNILCPLDGTLLTHINKQWQCENKHSFDIARQGYVNLLGVQDKKSKDPGDSKEMITARSSFLNHGFYAPIAQKIKDILLHQQAKNSQTISVLDAGCGEGYYLDYIHKNLSSHTAPNTLDFSGVDISKWAVMAAAKRNKKCRWFVASNKSLPFPDQSFDFIICGFGFPVWNEFTRLLKPSGQVIMIDPGKNHLHELKSIIYKEVREKPEKEEIQNTLHLLKKDKLSFKIRLQTQDQISSLFSMTPHLFRAPKEGKESLLKLNTLELTTDIIFETYGLLP